MMDMLSPGDRAIIDRAGEIESWRVVEDPLGPPWSHLAERQGRLWRVWLDQSGQYRVGRYRVIART